MSKAIDIKAGDMIAVKVLEVKEVPGTVNVVGIWLDVKKPTEHVMGVMNVVVTDKDTEIESVAECE